MQCIIIIVLFTILRQIYIRILWKELWEWFTPSIYHAKVWSLSYWCIFPLSFLNIRIIELWGYTPWIVKYHCYFWEFAIIYAVHLESDFHISTFLLGDNCMSAHNYCVFAFLSTETFFWWLVACHSSSSLNKNSTE